MAELYTPPLFLYTYTISLFTISLAKDLMLFILPFHSKAFSAFSCLFMPCVCFMPPMSLSNRSCACLSMSTRYVFSLPLVKRLVYVTLRYCFKCSKCCCPMCLSAVLLRRISQAQDEIITLPLSSSKIVFAIVCSIHILFYFECPQNPSYIIVSSRKASARLTFSIFFPPR